MLHAALTLAALLAFAANSVLCRLALVESAIDAWSFTALRLAAGGLSLALLVRGARRRAPGRASSAAPRPATGHGHWLRASLLLLYALSFSLAYVELETGTGALLLFGGVQLTMLAGSMRRGEAVRAGEWVAVLGASAGVAYLVLPGVAAPDPGSAVLMFVAAIGWGSYSLAGKQAGEPVSANAHAFARAAGVAIVLALLALPWSAVSVRGALLAALSGAVTSGLGYAVWYAALRRLTATRAAFLQLTVPVLAAGLGVGFLGEVVTARLGIASAVILGCVAVGLASRRSQG